MKKIAVFVIAGACTLLAAETPQARGKRVLDACVQALGGQRFLTLQNKVETGRAYSFYREQLSGLSIARIATRYLDGVEDPGRNLAVQEREDFSKKFDYGVLFLAKDAYEITWRGARPITEERFDRYRQTTLNDIFYIIRERLHEPGLILESRGSDVKDNMPVDIVDISDTQDRTVTVYIHQSTHLPTQQMTHRIDRVTKDRIDEVTLYSKYRDVDGVQIPFAVHRERNGEKTYEMYSDNVEINKKLPDKWFSLSGLQKLKPE